jgi:hypothetical protein
LSPPSSKPLRWIGPALAGAGGLVISIVLLRPGAETSPLAWWIANSALRPERILPLLGMGVAIGLMRPRAAMVAGLAFTGGMAAGLGFYEPLLAPLWALHKAAEAAFFTGPAAALAAGVTLVLPMQLRHYGIAPLALLAGIATTLGIVVTDPSIHDPSNRIAGVLIALWLPAAVALSVSAFRRPLFDTPGRILGSWLIAIGLLYGAAMLT